VEERELFGPWAGVFPGSEALETHPRYPDLRRKMGLQDDAPGDVGGDHG